MKNDKSKIWLMCWFLGTIMLLGVIGAAVIIVDPFFHYHKPNTKSFYYVLNNERSQNDGIVKHFDYDAMITGTSMTQNFRTSEVDRLFDCNSIKVAFSGATYKEVNNLIETALQANPNLQIVIRGLDMGRFLDSYDSMRLELGEYPTYLYDNNIFNDIQYLLNRDVAFRRTYQIIKESLGNETSGGITSFDEYSRWQEQYSYGRNSVLLDPIQDKYEMEFEHLSDEDRKIILKNIKCNVTDVADAHPNVNFYYFYTPYSVVTWNEWRKNGTLYKQLEAEALVTQQIVSHKNIHLYSFNNRTDITTDLNNYRDAPHYAAWISSLILKWMHEGKYQITEKNYKEYLKREYDFYTSYDYTNVNDQEDYEADYYAAALLNQELTDITPLDVLNSINLEIHSAEYVMDGEQRVAFDCYGALDRVQDQEDLIGYLKEESPVGIKFNLNLDEGYNYLSFYGQKIKDHGSLTAIVYDSDGNVVAKKEYNYTELDNDTHHYVLDLSNISGSVTIVLNGGYTDNSGSKESCYRFSNIYMY